MHRTLKFTVSLCALFCLATSALAQTTQPAAPAAAHEMVENPAYKFWSHYKPGTSVTMKGDTEAGGQKMNAEAVTTLVDVADDHLTIETTQKATMNGQTQSAPAQKVTVKKMVDKSETNQPGSGFDPELLKNAKEETVTVAAGTFKAKVIEFTKQRGPMTLKIKSWMSEEVPGGQVKNEVTGEGQVSMKSNMELTAIDKK